MRVDLKKFLFIGMEKDRTKFFEKAQEIGIVHFIDPEKKAKAEWPLELQRVIAAIKIVRSQPVCEQEESVDLDLVDAIVDEILTLQQRIENHQRNVVEIDDEIERAQPFGNFNVQDIQWIENEGNRKIQFFCAKAGFKDKEDLPAELLYLSTDENLDCFIAINKAPVQYDSMVEIKLKAPLFELQKQKIKIDKELADLEKALKAKAKYNEFLHRGLIHKINRDVRIRASTFAEAQMDAYLFAVEGWAPVGSIEALNQMALDLNLHVEEVAIEPSDVVPTYLKNHGVARIGEDLVNIYDTPSVNDTDPSLWVLFFFALFFSMIIGDAGYGLILLLLGLYFHRKQQKITPAGKRFFQLLYILSGTIIVWGVLNTSFFGMTIPMDSPIRKLSLMTWLVEKKTEYHFGRSDAIAAEWLEKFPAIRDISNPFDILSRAMTINPETKRIAYDIYDAFANSIAMELALLIGIIHIVISLLRYAKRNYSSFGWIAVLIGGYLFVPFYLDVTSITQFLFGISGASAGSNGLLLIYGGLGFALLASFFEHGWLGPVEALNRLIQLFSDSMSYLRLYALGLSGSLVTATMNDLASSMNIVFAAILLIFGHLVNLVLGIMGGVIHGLRLNFLEWYHYSFEGDGKRFSPLNKIEPE